MDADIVAMVTSVFLDVTSRPPSTPVDLDAPLDTQANWNSLTHLVLVVRLENALGLRFSETELLGSSTLRALAAVLANRLRCSGPGTVG